MFQLIESHIASGGYDLKGVWAEPQFIKITFFGVGRGEKITWNYGMTSENIP